MTALELILETSPLSASGEGAFLPLLEVAARLHVHPSTVRRMVWKGTVNARVREDGRSYDLDVSTLPPKYRAVFSAQVAAPGAHLHAVSSDETAPRFNAAPTKVKKRAERRYEAILSLAKARLTRSDDESLGEVERRWLRNFRRTHPDMNVSLRSVKEWAQKLEAAGGRIDALVDGNDGVKQRGTRSIPALAKQMFKDEFYRAHKPNIRLIYENILKVAEVKQWGAMPSYSTFRRYAESLPKLARKLLRDCADRPRSILPYVRRDPTTLLAYHTIQSDHREIDVPVRCDTGCDICTGKKPKGHFPIWTAFIDIRSRRILGSEISIAAPTSELVLGAFRRVCDEYGLPCRVYLDNGSDYRKAFGKRLRQQGMAGWDGPNEEQMRARFAPAGIEVVYALPYNAQAKAIERMFRTFRHRFDEDFEAYRGTLGNKSALAKELYYRPSELPTLSELAYLLQLSVDEYNARSHSGRGMEGRTPDQVFYDPEIRMPRRKPDAAFAYLFFELLQGGRLVGRNGVEYQKRFYRLGSLRKHLEYFGERVDVRINPDDERVAIIYDRRTGTHICEASLLDEATYNTRDQITADLIARVFRDGRDLLRMAKAEVEGARQRLGEYRAAKIHYLEQRAREIAAERQRAAAALEGGASVTVIGSFSAVARERGTAQPPTELTPEIVAEILDVDDSRRDTSPRVIARQRKAKAQGRSDLALRYADIAARLGISRSTLECYRFGEQPWPAGMKEQFDELERLRLVADHETAQAIAATPLPPRRTRKLGGLSYAAIARELGKSLRMLTNYRRGVCPWPEGLKERFEELERRRSQNRDSATDVLRPFSVCG